MRYSRYVLITGILASTGCSSLMAVSGVDPFVTDRNEARQRFGQPIVSRTDSDGSYDVFRTHLPLKDGMRFQANGMCFGMTFGVSEVIAVPHELWLLGKSVVGQEIRYDYTADGKVRTFHHPFHSWSGVECFEAVPADPSPSEDGQLQICS